MSGSGNIIFSKHFQYIGKGFKEVTESTSKLKALDESVMVSESDFIEYKEDDGMKKWWGHLQPFQQLVGKWW